MGYNKDALSFPLYNYQGEGRLSYFKPVQLWGGLNCSGGASFFSSLRWLLPRPGTLQAAWMDGIRLEKKSLGKYSLTGLFLLKWLFPLEIADLFH